MAIEIVNCPIQHGDFPVRYVTRGKPTSMIGAMPAMIACGNGCSFFSVDILIILRDDVEMVLVLF